MYFMIMAAKQTKCVSFPSKSSPFQNLQITEKLIKVHDNLLISEISQNPLNIPGAIFLDMNTKQKVLGPLTSCKKILSAIVVCPQKSQLLSRTYT